ncbi:protein adenylyltransferase SelO [Pseudofulvibacter geojedonensis]|uniref:Protein nucleotidyltransferase YdiU n=1 Tax=Pseudofulvibacter geojedonensis TaxID=1123758 RepID=A0ABW3I2W2_9FLAO
MKLNLHNTFTKELPSDSNLNNTRRQVHNACFSYVTPKKTSNPELLHVSDELLNTLSISKETSQTKEFLDVVTGNKVLKDTHPYAMCYGGHQFGNWAGQLGDGRAINLTQIRIVDKNWTLQLKGAGETPYSRTADGLAVLRSSIREYLCSEAMFHLGVPTTRALSLSLTGDQVMRDMLYDGNPAYEKGAIVCRVSESFIRFGSFEILSARKDYNTLQALADYSIKHHYPEITSSGKDKYIEFFRLVSEKTLEMIIHWQRVGFVHGVMNTDNMSILGQTIDYGPYGWLEGYDFDWTPNTTDRQQKRYRFGNQPNIGLWNLLQLANALYPLVEEAKPFEDILNQYKIDFDAKHLEMMKSKIGLFEKDARDTLLIKQLEENLHFTETDMTIFFRKLSEFTSIETEIKTLPKCLTEAFYKPNEVKENIKSIWLDWFNTYDQRLLSEKITHQERKRKMDLINPKYVLRNYMAQLAIDDANKGDYSLIDELYQLLKKPYDEQPNKEKWFVKRPEWARHKVGCSMLSCSS